MVSIYAYLAIGLFVAIAVSGYHSWVYKAVREGETPIGTYNRKRTAVAFTALTWCVLMLYFMIVCVSYSN